MCRNGIINGGTGSKSTTLGRPKLLHTISIGPCRRIRPLNSRTKLSDRRRILDGSFNSCYPLSAILLEISVNILPIRSAQHLNPFNIPVVLGPLLLPDLLPPFLIPVRWLKIHFLIDLLNIPAGKTREIFRLGPIAHVK